MNLYEQIEELERNSEVPALQNIINEKETKLQKVLSLNSNNVNKILEQSDIVDRLVELNKLQQKLAVIKIKEMFNEFTIYNNYDQTQVQEIQSATKNTKIILELFKQIDNQNLLLEQKFDTLNKKINEHVVNIAEIKLKNITTCSENINQDIQHKNYIHEDIEESRDIHDEIKRLKDRLKAYQDANKYMDALIKMPALDKRSGLMVKLYDAATTVAKGSVFLIPKTIAAGVSMFQYAMMTVVVDTVKQGWNAGRNNIANKSSQKILDKAIKDIEYIKQTTEKQLEDLQKEITQTKKNFYDICDSVIRKNDKLKKAYNELKTQDNYRTRLIIIMQLWDNRSLAKEDIDSLHKRNRFLADAAKFKWVDNLKHWIKECDNALQVLKGGLQQEKIQTQYEKLNNALQVLKGDHLQQEEIQTQYEKLNNALRVLKGDHLQQEEIQTQYKKVNNDSVSLSFATKLFLVVSAASRGVGTGVVAGVKNTTVNVLPGIKSNYNNITQNKGWGKGVKEIFKDVQQKRNDNKQNKAKKTQALRVIQNNPTFSKGGRS
ncbi:MAG: hypothetical protein H6909_02185 [Rickettsiaceae bacterium]|nr:hypothetical protein [Rickettsiaceae bacterium]